MAENSNLAIRDNPERHRLEVNFGDGSLAFAQYHVTHGRIVFTHTEVPKVHEGQGIGSALIRYALASARERGLKVVPVCPFFADYFKNHAEEQDLLDPESRAKLGLA
jgi:predicted GNAT family acetyltransferase